MTDGEEGIRAEERPESIIELVQGFNWKDCCRAFSGSRKRKEVVIRQPHSCPTCGKFFALLYKPESCRDHLGEKFLYS